MLEFQCLIDFGSEPKVLALFVFVDVEIFVIFEMNGHSVVWEIVEFDLLILKQKKKQKKKQKQKARQGLSFVVFVLKVEKR